MCIQTDDSSSNMKSEQKIMQMTTYVKNCH